MNEPRIHNAKHYQERGYVSVTDGDALKLIKDIAETFGIPLTGPGGIKRGFNWLGAAQCPRQPEVVIWWPAPANTTGGWGNQFSDDDMRVVECNASHEKSRQHVEERIAENRNRAVFKKEFKRGVGTYYRFVGLFRLNREESLRLTKSVWDRISSVDRFSV